VLSTVVATILFRAYSPNSGGGNGLEVIYIPAFALAALSAVFAIRAASRGRRWWVFLVVAIALFGAAFMAMVTLIM